MNRKSKPPTLHAGKSNRSSSLPKPASSRLNMRHFFALSLDLLCVAGVDGYFKRLNPVWEKTLGFSRKELLARPYLDFVHPDDRARTVAAVQKLVTGLPLATFENRYRCKEGSYKWLLWNALPVARKGLIYAAARDITERKQMETALRQSTERYRSLFEGVPVGIYRSTSTGEILEANPALVEMLGFPDRESLLATPAADLYVAPPERYHWQDAMEHDGTVHTDEVEFRRRDGKIIWVRDIARAVRDKRGHVLYYEGIWEDITQRKQSGQELGKLSSAVERTTDPILIASANGTIEYVNAAFEKVTGFSAQEAIGQTPRILKSGVHSQKFYRRLWDTILAGRPWWGTFVNRRKDGQLYFSEASIAPIFSTKGEITHFVSVERDITERKQTEKKLQEFADEISDLYNHAPCGYHSLDPEGVFTRINETELSWLGYARGEILQKKKFTEVIKEEDIGAFEAGFATLKERGWVRDLEFRMVRKDGTSLPVLVSATAVRDSAGRFKMSRSTVFDMTERLALEEMKQQELLASREMEVARQVQARLLPQTAPVLETLECASTCTQARAIGGDYYDFIDLSPGRVGFVVADVSGKGLSGALLMAGLRADLHSNCQAALRDLPHMLKLVNSSFYKSTDPGTFVSLFFGDYEDAARRIRYANCGHNPPLLVRVDGRVEHLGGTGLVLGLLPEWECSVLEAQMAPGDILVFFTDGIQEALNDAGEEFGTARLVETVRAHRHLPASSLLKAIATTVQRFSNGAQKDDQTLIVARVR
jgi:sigma-B regulation protein RsbU (phosphoserine phosphatase)